MKLILDKKDNIEETEIEIRFRQMTNRLSHIIGYLKQCEQQLEGQIEDKIYHIPAQEIYFIESTDRKTYFYTKDSVYESKKTLSALEQELEDNVFVRIGKAVIINITNSNFAHE